MKMMVWEWFAFHGISQAALYVYGTAGKSLSPPWCFNNPKPGLPMCVEHPEQPNLVCSTEQHPDMLMSECPVLEQWRARWHIEPHKEEQLRQSEFWAWTSLLLVEGVDAFQSWEVPHARQWLLRIEARISMHTIHLHTKYKSMEEMLGLWFL